MAASPTPRRPEVTLGPDRHFQGPGSRSRSAAVHEVAMPSVSTAREALREDDDAVVALPAGAPAVTELEHRCGGALPRRREVLPYPARGRGRQLPAREGGLRGFLNSRHTRDAAYVVRTVSDDNERCRFSTWAAKEVALIGRVCWQRIPRWLGGAGGAEFKT